MKRTIYTIGYGNFKCFSEFTDILQFYMINYLIDIRSIPFSKYYYQYDSVKLKYALPREGIQYIHAKNLGAKATGLDVYSKVSDIAGDIDLSTVPVCKRPDKCELKPDDYIVDFNKYRANNTFIQTVKKLRNARIDEASGPICVMCAEASPLDCHRYFYVGKELTDKYGDEIDVQHIFWGSDNRGTLLSQEECDEFATKIMCYNTRLAPEDCVEKRDRFLNLMHGWKK